VRRRTNRKDQEKRRRAKQIPINQGQCLDIGRWNGEGRREGRGREGEERERE
jgi:hypothetical protein